MKKMKLFATILAVGILFAGCGGKGEETAAPETPVKTEEEAPAESPDEKDAQKEEQPAEEAVTNAASLEELKGLLGMQDAETAELFGGGEENWTEDKSFYIGRIYEVELYEDTMPVYTSCDDAKIVNSVSIHVASDDHDVTEEEANKWVERVSEFTGLEPVYNETSSEVGSKNWKWVSEETIISMHWLDDLLSISMNPAVGELK